jgi:hypothetical protein
VSLTAAERLADSAFAWDVQWYLAVAEERAGDVVAARKRLTRLCAQLDSRQQVACEAVKRSKTEYPMRRTWSAAIVCSWRGGVDRRTDQTPTTAQDIDALLAEARIAFDGRKPRTPGSRSSADSSRTRARIATQEGNALCGIAQVQRLAAVHRSARVGPAVSRIVEKLAVPFGIGTANELLASIAEMVGDYARPNRAARAITAFAASGDRPARARATLRWLHTGLNCVGRGGRCWRAPSRIVVPARIERPKPVRCTCGETTTSRAAVRGRLRQARGRAAFSKTSAIRAALGTVFNSLGRVYRRTVRSKRPALADQGARIASGCRKRAELMQSLNAVAAVHGCSDT